MLVGASALVVAGLRSKLIPRLKLMPAAPCQYTVLTGVCGGAWLGVGFGVSGTVAVMVTVGSAITRPILGPANAPPTKAAAMVAIAPIAATTSCVVLALMRWSRPVGVSLLPKAGSGIGSSPDSGYWIVDH